MSSTAGRSSRWTTAARASGVALALVLGLSACASAEPPGPAPTTTAESEVTAAKAAPPAPVVPLTWPLTGVETAEVAARPALAVKIENSTVSRPQTGLEQADMVWEEVVEGGITRFVAVYHSQAPEVVEPVRSVRPMDPAIVAPLRGLLAYSGAQQPFIDAVNAAGIQSIIMDKGHAGFSRDRRRAAPHNVIGNMAAFWGQADGNRAVPPPAQLRYAREVGKGSAATAGTPANRLDITLSRTQRTVWDWDAGSGTYLRSDGGTPAVSTAGTRLSARNVLLLSVEVVNTPFLDPSGAPVPETKLVAAGTGVLATGGKSVPVNWSKASVGDLLVVTLGDGKPALLDPGNTWIELVPAGSGSWAIG
ncbi:DUF3048 domain-containing protein [Antribacter sp. KLBMP9083]|uniref:DUF3048 domain-containing protein n=1 Tax=Antribacter soli TaxID=2910976 RepID=A0AA41QC20_9MICO|nr:DUF3048 domain-containing protein [Antribacter soli]MCF4119394.1 DUF3048 domain-containing protein [Antribacter soli]